MEQNLPVRAEVLALHTFQLVVLYMPLFFMTHGHQCSILVIVYTGTAMGSFGRSHVASSVSVVRCCKAIAFSYATRKMNRFGEVAAPSGLAKWYSMQVTRGVCLKEKM